MADFLNEDVLYLILQAIVIIVASSIFLAVFNRFIRLTEEKIKLRRGHLVYIRRFLQILVYSIAVILILRIFRVDVTGLVAGLGIGAIIIGFGLKEIIENWVSGLLIITGKTYRIGDMITVDNLKGVVTDISLRTTKLMTYDRNEIIIPNSTLLRQKIINLTGGRLEMVVSITSNIDIIFDVDRAKQAIEEVLRGHPNVVVAEESKREIRHVVRLNEWNMQIETLFWINIPEDEEFIKSKITESIKKKFEEEGIMPPIPSIIRREFLGRYRKTAQENQLREEDTSEEN